MTTTSIDQTRLQEVGLATLGHLNGLMTSLAIHYGGALGIYEVLREAGPASSAALAARTGLHERWLREWLHQQAAAGVLEHERGERFAISPEAVLVLADDSTPASMAGFFAGIPAIVRSLEHLPAAFGTGNGRGYDDFGDGIASFVEQATLPWNEIVIGHALPALEGVVAKLNVGAQAIDFGCGAGARTVGMAEAFPSSTWRGYDTSTVALARAAQNLAASGVPNVSFHDPAREPIPRDHSFDLVTMFDVAHDLADPLGALRAVRAALKPDGTLVVSEIAQPEMLPEKLMHPAAPMLFGFSLGICLQCGLSEPGGAGLGALGLPEAVLRDLGARAWFTRFRRTEVADPFNAYYELRP